jgi:hypothetical protein
MVKCHGTLAPREPSCAGLSRVVSPYGLCAFVANMARAFLDRKEQDQANLKKRSQPIGLHSRHGQDAENATVIDLMKTAVVGDGGFTPENQSHADSLSWIRRTLALHVEMREISLMGAP